MKTKRNLSASIPNETRKAVYARDGYRCALCDDTHGLQIHHIVHRSVGGNDTPCNLITLCWRCHAEAHGTWVAERHAVRPPHTAEERYAAYRMLQDEYEQMCVEYVSDYYAERGEEWWPYKSGHHFRRVTVARGGDCGCMGDARGCRGGLRRGLRRCRAAPPLPLVVLPPDGVSTLRYARGPLCPCCAVSRGSGGGRPLRQAPAIPFFWSGGGWLLRGHSAAVAPFAGLAAGSQGRGACSSGLWPPRRCSGAPLRSSPAPRFWPRGGAILFSLRRVWGLRRLRAALKVYRTARAAQSGAVYMASP